MLAWLATRPEDKLKISRSIFAYENPSAINRVTFTGNNDTVELIYNGRQWKVNGQYEADPQRISVLFAILKQMRVRRRVAKQQQGVIVERFKNDGMEVAFFEGDDKVHDFYVYGEEESRLTYVAESPESPAYIVEIPGYRSYLAGIYQLDKNGWRNPVAFDINWANLQSVKVIYPGREENSFDVVYGNSFYKISQLTATDTTKLTDFLDDVSLLYVNDYLNEDEEEQYSQIIKAIPQASVQVTDVAGRIHTLEVYDVLPDNRQIMGRIDSTDYVILNLNETRKILRPKSFFEKKKE
ncbi:hypothetical protein C900_04874 [Fulvivirga imtechensis AK7]|uniref:DUF4340 domain-containing protein n=2 Tax=Fulvivirga TaxID=396811 RepID=L8JQ88_9BACT|nr:hypothetical protein C900_04874 [Fulvivirga imtechensis AK7]